MSTIINQLEEIYKQNKSKLTREERLALIKVVEIIETLKREGKTS